MTISALQTELTRLRKQLAALPIQSPERRVMAAKITALEEQIRAEVRRTNGGKV